MSSPPALSGLSLAEPSTSAPPEAAPAPRPPPSRAANKDAKAQAKAAAKAKAAARAAGTPSAAEGNDSSISGSSKAAAKAPRGPRGVVSPVEGLSRALAYLLRHGLEKESLPLRADGFVPLAAILARPRVARLDMGEGRAPNADDARAVVDGNDKKRFELKDLEGEECIRAVQGHSVASVQDLDMVPLTLSNLSDLRKLTHKGDCARTPGDGRSNASSEPLDVEVLHGTTLAAWDAIRSSGGLSRMKRNHIHLAAGRPGSGIISGMRTSSPLIVHVDVRRALAAEVPFFVAANGAVLTPGVGESGMLPLEYISHVEDKQGTRIWERAGDAVSSSAGDRASAAP